jgi:6-phosphogluconolactonase (cycloisomerase 2 family)
MALTLTNIDNLSDSAGVRLAGAVSCAFASINGKAFVYVAGEDDNGVTSFELTPDGFLIPQDNVNDGDPILLAGASAVAVAVDEGQPFVFTAGFVDDGLGTFVALAGGDLLNTDNDDDVDDPALEMDGAAALTANVFGGIVFVFVAGSNDDGISMFGINGNDGTASNSVNVQDNATLELNGVDALATASFGPLTNYLFAGGGADDGISVFSIAELSLTNVENVDDGDNVALELDGVSSLTTAVVGSKTFLFACSRVDDGVSVFEIASNGSLTNVDNVTDDTTWELDGASAVHVAKIAGTTYLFVAGEDDDGVSVFAVAADGSLINFGEIPDRGLRELDGASAVTTAVAGGKTFLIVTGSVDDGVSTFAIDTTGVTINGTSGNDVIDALNAPPGELLPSDLGDTLIGGLGKDTMSGGAGGDFFDFNVKTESTKGANRDVILDFSHGEGDRIDLAGIDAKSGVGGNQRFTFIGKQSFHHEKGELHFIKKAGFVVVEGDTNGDGRPDFQIQVDDVNVLRAGDFVL